MGGSWEVADFENRFPKSSISAGAVRLGFARSYLEASDMSLKTPQVIPYLYYDDVPGAIAFLTTAFGFSERMRAGTPRGGMHAEIALGDQIVMLGQGAAEKHHKSPREAGLSTAGVFIYLDDVDAHFALARDAEADIVEPLKDLSYGRSYTARDPEGHSWFFTAPQVV